MDYARLKANADKQWQQLTCLETPLIFIGMGTCGRAAGADQVLAAVAQTLEKRGVLNRIIQVGCIGMCYLEPIMAIRKPGRSFIYYANLTPQTAESIVLRYFLHDDPCVALALCTMGDETIAGIPPMEKLPMMRGQVRIALRNCGLIDPEEINHYIAQGGYAGIANALAMSPEAVIQEIKAAGLRGRGGAGFPTGVKWELARKAGSQTKYFICNADEGDPGAFMDRSLLEGDPHSVLEGMLIGAYAIGAAAGYVYVRAEYPLAIRRITTALQQMQDKGLFGDRILGSDFGLHIKIKQGAGAFVCGEETALMASIEGARGMPRHRPPFPAQKGLWGKPTNINNVETLSNVSAILANGAQWYARFGTEQSRGTKTFSLAGNVRRTGLIEVPLGISLGEIIHDIGGGVPANKVLKAVQTGGPSGGCIPRRLLHLPVDYEALAEAGAIMGSGGMVVMDEETCMVDMARYFLSFTHAESCGKCLPCRLGTRQMLEILEDICSGRGQPDDIQRLQLLCEAIRKGSLCGLGQTVPNPVLTTLRYFFEEYESHIHGKHCPATVCGALFRAPCQHACPVGMDIPVFVALAREDRLPEAYTVMLKTNPFPAVCGRVCDHPCQSRCRRGTLDDPIAIKHLKRYITDHAQRPAPAPLAGTLSEKVAVIGAGPAGLSAAHSLRMRGYAVTIFEALPEPGGMLRYGIPAYRLPKDILAREIEAILQPGIDLRLSVMVGENIPWFYLLDEFDAVFIAVGAGKSATLGMAGESLQGVQGAVTFLQKVNSGQIADVGQRVVVIGGGNAAVDAARTVLRLGAQEVHILYRRMKADMPAIREEIEAARIEGIQLLELAAPVKILGTRNRVTDLICQRMTLGTFDTSGRRKPISMPFDGEIFQLPVDQVLVAIGQQPVLPMGIQRSGVEILRSGLVSVQHRSTTQTSHPKVFAGGDVVSGPGTVIQAIAAGQKAAEEIDHAIRQQKGYPAHIAVPEKAVKMPESVEPASDNQTQVQMPIRPLSECRKGFKEVALGYTVTQAKQECRRCLRCDIRIEEEQTIQGEVEEIVSS